MSKSKKIRGTVEAWENGDLGLDEKYAKVSDLQMIDEVSKSLGLKSISLRMQPDLLEELKMIADLHGIGYQPLIKQVLRRFVDAELKMILREVHSLEAKPKEQQEENMQNCA